MHSHFSGLHHAHRCPLPQRQTERELYRLNDFKGLYLEVKPNGVKAWRHRFKVNEKASWLALGDYPSVSLAEAREKSEEARKLVKTGINPVQDRVSSASNAHKTRATPLKVSPENGLPCATRKTSPRRADWTCLSE